MRDSQGPRPAGTKQLPRGRHGLPREVVVSNQRERIIAAIVAVCATKGYPQVTVEDITGQAGVSRRTFYALFADKEDCFLVAYDLFADRLLSEVTAAVGTGERPWCDQIADAIRALVGRLAAEPAMARFMIAEVLAAGRPALDRRDRSLARLQAFLEPGRQALPPGMLDQDRIAQAVVGGLYEALCTQILEGEAAALAELIPDLVYCALLPYLGHRRALAAGNTERARQARLTTDGARSDQL